MEDSIYIAYGPNGKATGEGFVEFRNEADYKAALCRHKQYMGNRFIQKFIQLPRKVSARKDRYDSKRTAELQLWPRGKWSVLNPEDVTSAKSVPI